MSNSTEKQKPRGVRRGRLPLSAMGQGQTVKIAESKAKSALLRLREFKLRGLQDAVAFRLTPEMERRLKGHAGKLVTIRRVKSADGPMIRVAFQDGEIIDQPAARPGRIRIERLIRSLRERLAVRAAEAQGAAPEAFAPSEQSIKRLRAIERGREIMEHDLKAAGGTLSTRDVAEHLGISTQAVDKQRKAGKLLAVPGPEGRFQFPMFQFTRPAVRKHLPEVLGRLRETSPFGKLHWLMNLDSRLGDQTPVDLLDRGDVGPVLRAADEYGEHAPG
jgi:hypothetical protein